MFPCWFLPRTCHIVRINHKTYLYHKTCWDSKRHLKRDEIYCVRLWANYVDSEGHDLWAVLLQYITWDAWCDIMMFCSHNKTCFCFQKLPYKMSIYRNLAFLAKGLREFGEWVNFWNLCWLFLCETLVCPKLSISISLWPWWHTAFVTKKEEKNTFGFFTFAIVAYVPCVNEAMVKVAVNSFPSDSVCPVPLLEAQISDPYITCSRVELELLKSVNGVFN